jgi:DNA helicase IV
MRDNPFFFEDVHELAERLIRRLIGLLGEEPRLSVEFVDDYERAPAELKLALAAVDGVLTTRQWRQLPAAVEALARCGTFEAWREEAELQAANRRSQEAAYREEVRRALEVDFLSACERYRGSEELERQSAAFVQQWCRGYLTTDRKKPLDLLPEQARAVAAVGRDTLVGARAGSGKTSIIVTRAVFLAQKCGVAPSEMLLLAFNTAAAKEMKDRLAHVLGERLPHVMTFHALAYALVQPAEGILKDEELTRTVQDIIDDCVRSGAKETSQIKEVMLAHFREDWERIEEGKFVLPMEQFLAYRRSLPRETLRGEVVKSFGEKLIANTLFEYGLDYRYESSFRWDGVNYRPDFMLRLGNDTGVIIEYFGLAGDPDYDEMSERKRSFWREPERARRWRLLTYEPTNILKHGKDAFVQTLVDDLANCGLKPARLDEEEIWQRIRARAVGKFTKVVVQFIKRARILGWDAEALTLQVAAHSACCEAEKRFLEVGTLLFPRYLGELEARQREDFPGLMWTAVARALGEDTRFVRDKGSEKGDLRQLRFVFIDEFQDFTAMYYALLVAVRECNEIVEVFCVGDDWQAINSYSGADLKYFEEFDGYFTDTARLQVSTNLRSAEAIVDIGNSLMRGCGTPACSAKGAKRGEVLLGWMDDFSPSPVEEQEYGGDDYLALTLRVVSSLLNRGLDVVLLARTNHVRTMGKELTKFLESAREHLPLPDRRRVSASTVHSYKGLEQDAVVILDVIEGCYPLVHPDWIFTRVFGGDISRIVEEERRLFYVALTRAKEVTILLSERRRRSPFIERFEYGISALDWARLPQVRSASAISEFVVIWVVGAFGAKDALGRLGFQYHSASKRWYRAVPLESHDFERDVLSQSWAHSVERVEVRTASDHLLHSTASRSGRAP